MNCFIVIVIGLSISWNTTICQSLSPLDLAEKIFNQNGIEKIDEYVTGEYNGNPNGKDFPSWVKRKFRLLKEGKSRAVVQMSLRDSSNYGFDSYLHFTKDKKWKLTAFRALALTGIIEQVVQQLEELSPQQIDSIINKCSNENKKNQKCLFTSKLEYEYLLGNAKLTLDFDDNIVNHFLKNVKEFNRLKDLAELEKLSLKDKLNFRQDLLLKYENEYKALFISNVYSFGESGINFLIGGIVDNSVGYFYVSDKEEVPEMSPDYYIMILEIGDGWYLYKTT